MNVPASSPAPSLRRVYLFLAIGIVAGDQLTKALVGRAFELHESRSVIDGLVSLTHVQNRGAAFGLFSDAGLPYQSALFTLVSLLALAAIGVYAWRLPPTHRLAQGGLALVMGGAVGNLLDRARLGHVIDFVDVYWGPHHWPAFNLADSAISVGVALLVLDILRAPRSDELPAPRMDAASSAGERD